MNLNLACGHVNHNRPGADGAARLRHFSARRRHEAFTLLSFQEKLMSRKMKDVRIFGFETAKFCNWRVYNPHLHKEQFAVSAQLCGFVATSSFHSLKSNQRTNFD